MSHLCTETAFRASGRKPSETLRGLMISVRHLPNPGAAAGTALSQRLGATHDGTSASARLQAELFLVFEGGFLAVMAAVFAHASASDAADPAGVHARVRLHRVRAREAPGCCRRGASRA